MGAVPGDDRIAVIGRAGRFPACRTVTDLWRMISAGRVSTRRLSEAELLEAGASRADLADPAHIRAANLLPDMAAFDAGFFGFSPREAAILDPQHRHFLECGWEALEDAGHMPEAVDGRIGVYAGSGMQAYLPYNLLSDPALVDEIGLFLLRHTGNDKDFLPTRLSYLLNLQGPSMAVQTACSTGLVAVHAAVGALLNMECDMALAGGVTIELPHGRGYRHNAGEFQSADGLCRPFDDASRGTVFGSGAAMVVLRRLEDALADGDDVKAVILGSAVNNDGQGKAGYLAPSVDGQAEAAAEALALADVPPETVTYIEAHGTGTPVGDPIELAALGEVYGPGGRGFAGIGSIKSNIGHLDTAAGTAALIKVVEALRHRRIPATANFRRPNARFDLAASPFRVVSATEDWVPAPGAPRRGAVNALGIGGTNAHVVLEEAPARVATQDDGAWRVLPFSARTPASLDSARAAWRRFLDDPDPDDALPALPDIAFTLRHGRRGFAERMAVAARCADDLAAALRGARPDLVARGRATGAAAPQVVFSFAGGGAAYPGAGRALLEGAPAFRAAVEECLAALPADAPADLRVAIFDADPGDAAARARLQRPEYGLPALLILQYAYGRLWQGWGIEPAAILAHSAGEYTAAVFAGAMALKDALALTLLRGRLMAAAPRGAMTAIAADEATARALAGAALDLTAINAPEACVLSGTPGAVAALEERLRGTEHEAHRLPLDVAGHSRLLDGVLDPFRAGLAGVVLAAPDRPVVSAATGRWAAGGDLASADYWVRHTRDTVRYADAVATVLDAPDRVLLEVGPGQVVTPLAAMAGGAHPPRALVASDLKPGEDGDRMGAAVAAFGALWAAGVPVDWARGPGGDSGRRVSLPTYAFEKTRHWIDAPAAPEAPDPEVARRADLADWVEGFAWEEHPAAAVPAPPGLRWLVLAGRDPVSQAVLARLAARGEDVVPVRFGAEAADAGDADGAIVVDSAAPEAFERVLDGIGAAPDRILMLWPLDPRAAEAEKFDAAFGLLRAAQTRDWPARSALVLATRGALDAGGTAVRDPDAAALTGPLRVAPREIPGMGTVLADLDDAMAPEDAARALIDEAELASDAAPRVAWRGTRRLVERRVPLAPPAGDAGPGRLRRGGVYVITGGTGGIGRALALWLARTAAARVALVARGAAPDAELAEAIAGAGGAVLSLAADVTDKAALAAALERVRAEWGTIHGAIHAAGTIADAPLSTKTLADAHRVIAPKLAGARHLDALLPPGSLDLFAVFSSSSVVTGPAGQTDYVAANAALEAVAAARPDGLAIAWGIWRDLGLAQAAYGGDGAAGGHPLLGPRQEVEGAVEFRTGLDPAHWVVADHLVAGRPVLPGTAYIEIAYAAGRAVLDAARFEIAGLTLSAPMVFATDLPRSVTVRMRRDGSAWTLSVESTPGAGAQAVEHARARLEPVRRARRRLPQSLARPASGSRQAPRSGRPWQDGAVGFGPRWRNVGEVRICGDTAEGRFALAPEFRDDTATWSLHPGLLDMAVSVGLHLFPAEAGRGVVFAPVRYGRIRVLAPLGPVVTARARRIAEDPGRYALFDVALLDGSGRPLVIVEGLAVRGVPEAALSDLPDDLRLLDRMLAAGIRAEDAAPVFARAFALPAGRAVVSSIDLEILRAAMAEPLRPREPADEASGAAEPDDPVEARIVGIWRDLLGVSAVAPDDDFFDLGGHSLAGVRMFARLNKAFDTALPLSTLFEAATPAALAALVRAQAGAVLPEGGVASAPGPAAASPAPRWTPLVRIRDGAPGARPLVCVHGAGGNVLNFRHLAGYLDPSLPFYGLRALGSDGGAEVHRTIPEMAQAYVAALRELQPEGPYRLAGYSGGGVIALEMAQQIRAAGGAVEHVILFDTLAPHVPSIPVPAARRLAVALRHWRLRDALAWHARRQRANGSRAQYRQLRALVAAGQPVPEELLGHRMTALYRKAQAGYRARAYDGPVTLFKAARATLEFLAAGRLLGWDGVLTGPVRVESFDCDHFSMMSEPAIAEIGAAIGEILGSEDQAPPWAAAAE